MITLPAFMVVALVFER